MHDCQTEGWRHSGGWGLYVCLCDKSILVPFEIPPVIVGGSAGLDWQMIGHKDKPET